MIFLGIFLLTIFFSLGIQYFFYLYYKKTGSQLIIKHKTFFNYVSGIGGDGILLPLINIQSFILLGQLPYELSQRLLISSFINGVFITAVFHIIQYHFKLINWTMPSKGNWTYLGVYHAIFMWAECSFLSLTLFVFLRNYYFATPESITTVKYIIMLLIAFLSTMFLDNAKPISRKLFHKKIKPVVDYALANMVSQKRSEK